MSASLRWPGAKGAALPRVTLAALTALLLTTGAAKAQCTGDCNADGRVTVDELVTLVGAALGPGSATTCAAGDSNLDDRIGRGEIIAAAGDALTGCSLRRTYDFRAGAQGWEAIFADYAPGMEPGLELEEGLLPLPAELELPGSGYLLSGFNQSDDLFMGLVRRLTTADGIEPGRAYALDYTIVVASAAPSFCPGIGGAPGESVFLKAGAAGTEPATFLDLSDGVLRLNVAKGEQSQDGSEASVLGNAANGLPCEPGNDTFVSLRFEHRHLPPVAANGAGELWLLVGSDSGFEGTTSLYYQRIEVKLTPVEDLHLNDVSILFPLPPSAGLDDLLSPSSAGVRGPLLPPERYAAVPKLHVFQSPEETYGLLRVVALRLDPCFVTDSHCRPQLRLTMQPVVYDAFQEAVRADDAAIHLFYDLQEDDFTTLLAELRDATAAAGVSTAGPLRVHPILAAEGLDGPFAERLRAAVLRAAGGETLTRLTFMQLQNFNVNEWVFGGFEIEKGELVPMDIVDAGTRHQRFINVILESEEDFVASVEPPALGVDDISLLFNSNNARAAGEDAIAAAERAALRIENPRVHTTESVSCVACHTATQARLWIERSLARSTEGHPDRYTAAADLELSSETTRVPGSLRAFGYLHRRVAISQRTVNESAEVLAALRAPPRDIPPPPAQLR